VQALFFAVGPASIQTLGVMFDNLLSSKGFGPAVLATIVGWIPVLVPLAYLAIFGRALPRKLYFVGVCSAFTLGLPIFFLMGLEAPLLVIQPLFDVVVLNTGLQQTAPFSWIQVALRAVSRWWWLATILAFIFSGLVWSAAVSWWLGRRWPAIAAALGSSRKSETTISGNDA
jgi:hypothetical protein